MLEPVSRAIRQALLKPRLQPLGANLVDRTRLELATASLPAKSTPNCATTALGGSHEDRTRSLLIDNQACIPLTLRNLVLAHPTGIEPVLSASKAEVLSVERKAHVLVLWTRVERAFPGLKVQSPSPLEDHSIYLVTLRGTDPRFPP
jgi:hypothetical protein